LRIDYHIRDDGEVDYVEIHSICSACEKARRQFHFEVDRNIYQDPGATIKCIRDYSYLVDGYKGWEYQLGTPAWDIRR
jgi:hypothetical protein